MKTHKQFQLELFRSDSNLSPILDPRRVGLGQKVLYMGSVNGGPARGTSGIVKHIYARKAVVDMGVVGMWNVPYYFLATNYSAA